MNSKVVVIVVLGLLGFGGLLILKSEKSEKKDCPCPVCPCPDNVCPDCPDCKDGKCRPKVEAIGVITEQLQKDPKLPQLPNLDIRMPESLNLFVNKLSAALDKGMEAAWWDGASRGSLATALVLVLIWILAVEVNKKN